MLKKSSKEPVIVSIIVFVWIFLVNIAAILFVEMPTWPMFFVAIFFFVMGGNVKNIPTIFLSGAMGIVFALVLAEVSVWLTPIMGELGSISFLLFIILGCCIVLGNYFPLIFNNITFAYLTIATLDINIIEQNFVGWILVLLIGGGVILVGALAAVKLGRKLVALENTESSICK